MILLLHELLLLLAHSKLAAGVVCSIGWELILRVQLLSEHVALSFHILASLNLHLSQAT